MSELEPPPEALLIERLRNATRPKLSIRAAAEAAGISDARWRQIAKGHNQASKDVRVPARAPSDTLARMAKVVGATPDQLREVGREDAADELVAIGRSQNRPTPTESRKARVDRLLSGNPYGDDPDLDFILTTLQTAVGMMQKRELWMAIQLINQSSKDLSDYLDAQGASHAVRTDTTQAAQSDAQAEGNEGQEAGDGEEVVRPIRPAHWDDVPPPPPIELADAASVGHKESDKEDDASE